MIPTMITFRKIKPKMVTKEQTKEEIQIYQETLVK